MLLLKHNQLKEKHPHQHVRIYSLLAPNFFYFYLQSSNSTCLPLLSIIRLLLSLLRPTCQRLCASSY